MPKINLSYGDGILSFEIDDGVLGEVVSPRSVEAASDAKSLIRNALKRPIGSPSIDQLVHPGQKVAVIIDDITRRTPTHLMLPEILSCLLSAGVEKQSITIVIALGTHRPMTTAENLQKIGPKVFDAYDIIDIPAWNDAEMVYMGKSSNGIPAWVNRHVIEADFRIGIGMITPHMDAGFSGGGKIILPGVCSLRTVNAFHARQAKIMQSQLGVVNAVLRQDLETFVGEHIGLNFILNAVLDRRGLLYKCVAGHFVQAHRVGVGFAKQVYGSPVIKRYPVVISNAYPFHLDLWQSTKALASGEMMTTDGGILILVAHCQEGNNTHPLIADYIGRDPEKLLDELESGHVEDPVACALAIPLSRMKRRIRFGLVSSGLSSNQALRMGFSYYKNLETAIRSEIQMHEGQHAVGVLTHGGVTLPIID